MLRDDFYSGDIPLIYEKISVKDILPEIFYGPQNKNLYTIALENFIQYLLRLDKPGDFVAQNENGKLKWVYFEDNFSFPLSDCLSKSNITHLMLNKDDENLYLQKYCFLDIEDYRLSKEFNISPLDTKLITDYTGFHFFDLNSFLRGKINQRHEGEEAADVISTLLESAFLCNALNRLEDCSHPSVTFRGEYIEDEDNSYNQTRVQDFNQKSIGYESAFTSTSMDCLNWGGNTFILFENPIGKDISSYSIFEHENEYLMFPGQVIWKGYLKEKEMQYFIAESVRTPCSDITEYSKNELCLFLKYAMHFKNNPEPSVFETTIVDRMTNDYGNNLLDQCYIKQDSLDHFSIINPLSWFNLTELF